MLEKTKEEIAYEELIKEDYVMACHNLMCYSKNLLMTKAKEGFEAEWEREDLRVRVLTNVMKEMGITNG